MWLGIQYVWESFIVLTKSPDPELERRGVEGVPLHPGITTTYGPSIVYVEQGGATLTTLRSVGRRLPNLPPVGYRIQQLVRTERVDHSGRRSCSVHQFFLGNIMASGLPVVQVIPEEGLVGSFSVASVVKGTKRGASHFIDHLLSYEVHQLKQWIWSILLYIPGETAA